MAVEYDLDGGFDPTALSVITGSELLQLIEQALPKSIRGFVVFSATQPDIINNPHLVRYLWIDTSAAAPYIVRAYNVTGGSWDALEIEDNAVTTAKILDGAVTVAKLNAAAGSADDLLKINAGGTAFEYISLANLMLAATIPLTSIQQGGASTNHILYWNGSAWTAAAFDADDIIPANTLDPTANKNSALPYSFLVSNALNIFTARVMIPSTDIPDNTIPGSKILTGSITADKLASVPGSYNDFPVKLYVEYVSAVINDNFTAVIAAIANVVGGFTNLLHVNTVPTGYSIDMKAVDAVFDQTELDVATGSPGSVDIDDITELICLVQYDVVDPRPLAGLFYYDGTTYRIAHAWLSGDPSGTDHETPSVQVTIPKLEAGVINLRLGASHTTIDSMGFKILGYKI